MLNKELLLVTDQSMSGVLFKSNYCRIIADETTTSNSYILQVISPYDSPLDIIKFHIEKLQPYEEIILFEVDQQISSDSDRLKLFFILGMVDASYNPDKTTYASSCSYCPIILCSQPNDKTIKFIIKNKDSISHSIHTGNLNLYYFD